jgi:ABC-type nitrate/sulfonate/bicarbonate transport system permease component
MHDVLEHGNLPAAGVRDGTSFRRIWRNAYPFIVVGAVWETVAHFGLFPAQFFPPLETIAAAFARLTASGVLPHHALDSRWRAPSALPPAC